MPGPEMIGDDDGPAIISDGGCRKKQPIDWGGGILALLAWLKGGLD